MIAPSRLRAIPLAILLAAATMLVGCSTLGLLNAAAPRGGIEAVRGIAYAPGDRHSLDVYAPRARAHGRPIIVFFYGGSWDSGARGDYAWLGYALAKMGYLTIVPDYRLYPEVRWPSFLEDCALATRWAHDHGADYGGDPTRLVLMGHSAGAYNAVDMAVDERWLAAVGLSRARDVRAVVGLSGPYDFLPVRTDELKAIFGPEAARPDTQPINHVDGHAAPMLLITGDRDTTVRPANSDRMAARVQAAGGQATVVHYPKLDHVRTLGALAAPLRWLAPVMADVTNFVNRETGFSGPGRRD